MRRKITYIIMVCILAAEWVAFYSGGREVLITANSGTIRHHYTDIVGVASGIYFVSGQRRRKVTENYKKDCKIVFWYMIVYCAVRILIRLSM